MNDKKIIWIKISNYNYKDIFNKLYDLNIRVYDTKLKDNYILLKINSSDYSKVKRYLFLYDISVDKEVGLAKISKYLKKYIYFFLSVIFGLIILLFINNISYKLEIKNDNKVIKNVVLDSLKKYKLTGIRFKKSHSEIEKIVKKIIEDNKDLEWLEIKYDGLKMIVYVVEKTKEDNKKEYSNCDLISKSDARIISMNVYRGEVIKEINDYVKKGDVILSGTITSNEEVKNKVCASGKVFGEVWYRVKIKMHLKEEIIEYTGKERYNISLVSNNKDNYIFRNRVSLFKAERTNLIKEKEYVKKENKLSEKEAYNKALEMALSKVSQNLSKEEEIINQKVLKKGLNNSTIYLEIFVVTKENIGYTKIIREDGLIDNQLDVKNN